MVSASPARRMSSSTVPWATAMPRRSSPCTGGQRKCRARPHALRGSGRSTRPTTTLGCVELDMPIVTDPMDAADRSGPCPIGSVNARGCFGSDRWTKGLDADECSSKIRLIGNSATAAAKSADTSRFCRRIVVQRRLRAPPRHGDQIVHISGREERIGARGYPLCHRFGCGAGGESKRRPPSSAPSPPGMSGDATNTVTIRALPVGTGHLLPNLDVTHNSHSRFRLRGLACGALALLPPLSHRCPIYVVPCLHNQSFPCLHNQSL